MPIPDLFRTAGSPTRADLATRAAALRLRAPQLTPTEAQRLEGRLGIDAENARVQGARTESAALRSANPAGIDVRSYSGSLYQGNMAPVAAVPGAMEATADAALRSRFGPPPNERGAVDVADQGGLRSLPTGQGPVPRAMMTPAAAAPPVIPGAFRETSPLIRGTAADPQEVDIRRRKDELGIEGARRALARDDAEGAAIRTAVSPSVGVAEQIRGGGAGLAAPGGAAVTGSPMSADPGEDPGLRYFRAGGREPAVAAALQRQPKASAMRFGSMEDLNRRYPTDKFDYTATVDPQTGEVSVPSVSPRAPASPAPNVFNNELESALGKQVASTIEKVPEHQATIEQVQRTRTALAAGAKVGGLAQAKLAFAQAVNGVLGDGTINTAATEIAKSSFSDMALAAAAKMRGQGQITESERALLKDTVAQLGNSPEAAAYIMNYMEAAANRALAKAQALQSLRDAGETGSSKYSRILASWEKDNPIKIEAPKKGDAAAQPSAAAVSYLRQNPNLASDFDAKYGAGASKRYIK